VRVRERVILALGTVGFLSQIYAQFTGNEPSFLIMGASLALLGVAPFLRADEAQRHDLEDRDLDHDRDRGGLEP
jgi:hypothetical protein